MSVFVSFGFPKFDGKILEVGGCDLILCKAGRNECDTGLRPIHVGSFKLGFFTFVVFYDEVGLVLEHQIQVGDALIENARISVPFVFDDYERF